MLTLLKNLECYCPDYSGKNDILIAGEKIYKLLPAGEIKETGLIESVIECDGLFAFPGLIDQHVHIIGGGGEQSFASRVPEIDISEILMAGVTTVVGLLGADGCTKRLESLYAKAKGLEAQGITTFIYTGSYSVPAVTFTNSIIRDLVLIDKVIGVGEIAISDHRSAHPELSELLRLASDTHLGGLLGGKAGVVHFHLGDGKSGLKQLLQIVERSDLPIEQFVPSHVNRNPALFIQSLEYLKDGGNIDLTAGETAGIAVQEAICKLLEGDFDLSKVTLSSDAGGSIPGGGVGRMQTLYDDLKACLCDEKLNKEAVIRLSTENVAKVLKLYPRKGALKEGSDADILITDKNYKVIKLFCLGSLKVDDGKVL